MDAHRPCQPIPFSVLDLAPIVEGGTPGEALRRSRALAVRCEELGYKRFWLAEHHNMPGIASAATAVAIGHVAEGTSRIRVGAGGIMLPNHAPLVIAEQFGTLDALFPDRIDLGLGRAPGTDPATAAALRHHVHGDADRFPNDVLELLHYFNPEAPHRVRAIPGAGAKVEPWILGSSTFGAVLAAELGLPYAFASHFAPADLDVALALYRQRFRPSERLERPTVMVAANVITADRDDEAALLATSLEQAFVRLRLGTPGPLPPPIEGFSARLPREARLALGAVLTCAFIGSPQAIRSPLRDFLLRTGADELIVSAHIYDHSARVRSYELLSELREDLGFSEVR